MNKRARKPFPMSGLGIVVGLSAELLAVYFLVLALTTTEAGAINPALGLGFGGIVVAIIDYWAIRGKRR